MQSREAMYLNRRKETQSMAIAQETRHSNHSFHPSSFVLKSRIANTVTPSLPFHTIAMLIYLYIVGGFNILSVESV